MFVQNVSGTRECPNKKGNGGHGVSGKSGRSNWICQWEDVTEQIRPHKCPNLSCQKSGNMIRGCHVVISPDVETRYIIPMCSDCNNPKNNGKWLEISSHTKQMKLPHCNCGIVLTKNIPSITINEKNTTGKSRKNDDIVNVLFGKEEKQVVLKETTKIMADLTKENCKTTGGRYGAYVGGGCCAILITIVVIIIIIIAITNSWNPIGWISIIIVGIVICFMCGVCAGSAVGKEINSKEYDKV